MAKSQRKPGFGELLALIEEAAALRPVPPGASEKGRQAFLSIIEAAREIFIDEGYAGISFGKLSEATGYGKGNIAYYFPKKADILNAVVSDELARRVDAISANLDEEATPSENLGSLIETLLRTNLASDRLVAQLWCVAINDKAASEMFNRANAILIEFVAVSIQMARPRLSARLARSMALEAATMISGVTLYSAIDAFDEREIRRIAKLTVQRIEQQIRSA